METLASGPNHPDCLATQFTLPRGESDAISLSRSGGRSEVSLRAQVGLFPSTCTPSPGSPLSGLAFGEPTALVAPAVRNDHPAWWGAALQLPGDKTRSSLMTMSGSSCAPCPSMCWMQNRAQYVKGQRTEPAFYLGHPGHLEPALRPGRTQKGSRQAKGCGELEVFLGLSLCCRG